MEYINKSHIRISDAVHINEIFKAGVVFLDEILRGIRPQEEWPSESVRFSGLESNLPVFQDQALLYSCISYKFEQVAALLFNSLGFDLKSFKGEKSKEAWARLQNFINRLQSEPIYFEFKKI